MVVLPEVINASATILKNSGNRKITQWNRLENNQNMRE